MDPTRLIATAQTLPFWWAVGLLAAALLGDASSSWRPRVSRLFDRLDRMGAPPCDVAPEPRE